MKAYAPYHVLYAVSQFFAIASNYPDRVPSPKVAYKQVSEKNNIGQIVSMAASCLNVAIEQAANEQSTTGKIFSPQNWLRTKSCLSGIKTAVRTQIQMLPYFPRGEELRNCLVLPASAFEYRWEAD